MSPLGDWLQDHSGRARATAVLREIAPLLGSAFGNDPGADVEELDAHFHSYFMAMPLRDVLEFAAAIGGPDPDDRLDELVGSLAPASTLTNHEVAADEVAFSDRVG
jgi:hypothetical protein